MPRLYKYSYRKPFQNVRQPPGMVRMSVGEHHRVYLPDAFAPQKTGYIGISLPGTFEEPKAPVYVDGEHMTTLRGEHIAEEFRTILDDYVDSRYGQPSSGDSQNPDR